MAHPSEPSFLALHALRLKGCAEAGTIAAWSGSLSPDDVVGELEAAAGAGLVLRRDGRVAGWSLTPEGRSRHAQLMCEESDAAACDSEIEAAYEAFLGLNEDLKSVCTDWQLDGRGTENEAKVIGRLHDLDGAVQPICARLAGALDRMANYGPRLANAVARVEAGDHDWFTRPLIDSYHSVWFELHEDLLITLGRRREEGVT